MNLQTKIKRDIRSHALMACHELDEQLAAIDFKALSRYSDDDDAPSYTVKDGVATIDVRGLLVPETSSDYRSWGVTGYANIADYIAEANHDYSVDSIVLDIDSGGGYVAGIDTATNAIKESSKPIQAFVSGDMYSAAYWLGATTERITAAKLSGIGSIGAYVTHWEDSKALEKWGEKVSLFRSGKWKAAFNSFMPLTDDEKARLQQGVDDTAKAFFEHVATERGLDVKTIADWEADTFDAAQAKELGLIDAIADSVAVSTSKTQSNNNPQSNKGESMDLQEALAKIGDLQAQVTAATEKVKAATAEAEKAKQLLAETQASSRQADIDKLASETGREFSAEQVEAFKNMSADQFAVAAALATPQTPKLPSGLDKEQATHGRHAQGALDDKFKEWSEK